MTLVRRRSPVVEAVQWHKPGDHPDVIADTAGIQRCHGSWPPLATVHPGFWIMPPAPRYRRVLTPEQFEQEYERVAS